MGVPTNYDGYRAVVENHLLQSAIGSKPIGGFYINIMGQPGDVEAWLTVSDEYGFSNWLNYPGWGYAWHWGTGLVQAHPEAISYNSLGKAQPDYSPVIDFFNVVFPWHRNMLKAAIDSFADHSSLNGFGSNPLTDYPVYMMWGGSPPTPGDYKDYGYNPQSLKNFTKTIYFLRDVDKSGHHNDGTPCKLWEQYVAKTASYSLVDLIDDVRRYHYANVREYPLHGYVAYMNVANAKLVKALYDWLISYRPDRTWIVKHAFPLWAGIDAGLDALPTVTLSFQQVYQEREFQEYYLYRMLSRGAAAYQPAASEVLAWINIGNDGDNPFRVPTDEEKYNVYLIGLPTLPMRNPIVEVDWEPEYLVNPSVSAIYRDFGAKLGLMRAYGGWFGKEASYVKALAIGESEIGWAPQLLTPVLDLTMTAGEWEENNLTRFGDFTRYDALIIWGGGRPRRDNLSPDCHSRIISFVSNGGGLTVFGSLPTWLSAVIGTGTPVTSGHPITRPFADLAAGPMVYEWTYGSGKIVQVLGPSLQDISRSSDFWVIATNAVLYSVGREDLIPAWFYEDGPYAATRWKNIYHSICGIPGKVLVWLSNRGTELQIVDVHLNPRFYGINPDGWLLLNPIDLSIQKGSGEITVRAVVPGLSWIPMYVVNMPADNNPAYCNLVASSKSASGQEARFTVEGPSSQSVRLIVAASSKPNFVGLTTLGGLAERANKKDLISSGSGWFYDEKSKLLSVAYVNPRMSGEVSIGNAVTVELDRGYNFISLPVTNNSFSASTLLEHIGHSARSIFMWDDTAQEFVSYDVDLAKFNVSQLDFPIRPDVGYIVYSSEKVSFDVEGTYATQRTIRVKEGYNLVGWTSPLRLKATTAFIDPSDNAVESVFGFDVERQEYVSYDKGLAEFGVPQPNFDILEGKAYFLFASKNSLIQYEG